VDGNNGRGNTVGTVMAAVVITAVTVVFFQHIFFLNGCFPFLCHRSEPPTLFKFIISFTSVQSYQMLFQVRVQFLYFQVIILNPKEFRDTILYYTFGM
jgi:hypothetical protein